jgi:hypothetical protein
VRKALLALAPALLPAGCGAGDTGTVTEQAKPKAPVQRPEPKKHTKRLARARCPAGVAGCRTANGLVVYTQAVDPDGDGDAHVAVAVRHGLTYPGITVLKFTKEMRPKHLPREGETVSAAGPVQKSSDGSPEIRAIVLHTRR